MAVGALAIAVVSASIGGGVASVVEHGQQPASSAAGATVGSAAPSVPAANAPAGSVEQVAAKVVPSVVMLETDLGRQSEEGSGIILSPDGTILTNNHVVAAAAKNSHDIGASPLKTTVTFSDGRTAPFTVVGADPTSDIAVVRVQGMSGLKPITLGSSANLRVANPWWRSGRRWAWRAPSPPASSARSTGRCPRRASRVTRTPCLTPSRPTPRSTPGTLAARWST
ncbi:trypsin-like peptidase domain protein [Mycobacterium xenopi 3993]|nr:trypsin-like peptidase domain protein [Mycobacterium xenopi 3993]